MDLFATVLGVAISSKMSNNTVMGGIPTLAPSARRASATSQTFTTKLGASKTNLASFQIGNECILQCQLRETADLMIFAAHLIWRSASVT